MNNRIRRCSLHSNSKSEPYGEDRISQLPEGILTSILSCLTIREAARTSVLSRRWENLWKSTTCLHFLYDTVTMWNIQSNKKSLKRGRKKFISWVNGVLELHNSDLNEFSVCFDLNKSSSQHVDKWITLVTMKRVKRLNIDFMEKNPCDMFTFPVDYYSFVKSPSGFSCIKLLSSLSLKYVNVTGELLEHFLLNCPLLELLFVHASDHLVNLRVVGSSLRLKYFQLVQCYSMKKLAICAPNLKSFTYFGGQINLQVQNLSHMVDLSIGILFGCNIDNAVGPFLSYFSQLVTLNLKISCHRDILKFQHFPGLTNLKHLILRVTAHDEDSLLGLSPLIKSSPCLNKFTLKLVWKGSVIQKEIKRGIKCPHRCLKIVEMVGFVGGRIDVELAIFFIENAPTLEKIIVDPRSPYLLDFPQDYENDEQVKGARKRAEQQLKPELSPSAELVIL